MMKKQGSFCSRAAFWTKIVAIFQIILGIVTVSFFALTLSRLLVADKKARGQITTPNPNGGGTGSSTADKTGESPWTERAALIIGISRSNWGIIGGILLMIGVLETKSIILIIWKYLAGLSLIVGIMVLMTDVAKHPRDQRIILNSIDIVFLSVGVWTIQLLIWDFEDEKASGGLKK